MKIELLSISAPRKPKATKKKETKTPASIEFLIQKSKPKLRLVHKEPGRYVLKSTRGVFSILRINKEVKYVPSMRQKIFALREMESLSSDLSSEDLQAWAALDEALGAGAYSEPFDDLEAEAISFEQEFLQSKGLDLTEEELESDSAAPGARNKAAGAKMGRKKRAPNMLAPGWHVFELPKAGGRTKRHYVGPRISGRRLVGIAQGEAAPESAKAPAKGKAAGKADTSRDNLKANKGKSFSDWRNDLADKHGSIRVAPLDDKTMVAIKDGDRIGTYKLPAKGKKAPAKKPATSKQSDAENKKLQQSLQKEIARTARSKVKLVSTINKKQLQVIKLKARIDQAKDKDKKKELAQKARDINTELRQLKRDLKAVDKELTKATSNKKRIEAIEAQKPSTKGAKYDKAKASLLKRIKTMEDRIAKAEEAYQNGGTKTQRRKVEDLEYKLEELEYKLEELEEGAETKLASQSSKKVNLKHLGNVDWDKILEHGLSPAQRKKALKALEKEGYDEIDFSSPDDIADDEILDALES